MSESRKRRCLGKIEKLTLGTVVFHKSFSMCLWLKYLASEQNLTSQSRDVEWEREREREREREADRHDTSHRVRTWANDVANRLNFDSSTGPKNCSLRTLTAIWKSSTRTPEKKLIFIMNPQTAVVWKSSIKAERLWRESDSDAFFIQMKQDCFSSWGPVRGCCDEDCQWLLVAVCLWGR